MALLLDSAYLPDVERIRARYPIHGVTTNPTLLLAAVERGQRLAPADLLRALLDACPGPIFMQPLARDSADNIRAEAEGYISRAPERVVPKLPMTAEGIVAGMALSKSGARIAFTATYTVAQAYTGALAGADWLIPYVGRLRRAVQDPEERLRQMRALLNRVAPSRARILAASVKSPEDVVAATLAGADDITAAPEVIEALLADEMTDAAFEQFARDADALRDALSGPAI